MRLSDECELFPAALVLPSDVARQVRRAGVGSRVRAALRDRDDVVEAGRAWVRPPEGRVDALSADAAGPPITLEDVPVRKSLGPGTPDGCPPAVAVSALGLADFFGVRRTPGENKPGVPLLRA